MMIERLTMTCILIISFAFWLIFHFVVAQPQSSLQTYIVHVNKPDVQVVANSADLESYYNSFLPVEIVGSEEPT